MKRLLLIASALAFLANAQAALITGTLTYISATVPNNPDLNLATSFAFFPAGIVVSATGDLVSVGATVVNAPGISGLPLGLGPAPASVPVLSLWSGGGFNFDLLALNVDFRSAIQFTASGTGIITAPGFDPTSGTWTLAITGAGPVLGFAAGTAAVVPEPSTYIAGALMLLPFGLRGLRHLRSRKQLT